MAALAILDVIDPLPAVGVSERAFIKAVALAFRLRLCDLISL